MQHLDEGTIHAWLDGALAAGERARVERHVVECAVCAAAVAEARGMIAGASRIVSSLDGVPANVIPRPSATVAPRGWLWRSLRLSPGRAALAATLMLAVGTMLTVQHSPPGSATASVRQPFPADVENKAAAAVPAPVDSATLAAPSIAVSPAAAATATAAKPVATPRAAPSLPVPVASPAAGAPSPPPMRVAEPRQLVTEDRGMSQPATGGSRNSIVLDSAGRTAAKSAGVGGAVPMAVGARAFAAAPRAQAAASDAAIRPEAVGLCYLVNMDSTATFGAALLPQRFSLQQTSGPAPQNVVHAVSPQGRIDSVITGKRWERVTPTTTRVYLNESRGDSSSTLTLHFANGSVAGELVTPRGMRNVTVSQQVCRP